METLAFKPPKIKLVIFVDNIDLRNRLLDQLDRRHIGIIVIKLESDLINSQTIIDFPITIDTVACLCSSVGDIINTHSNLLFNDSSNFETVIKNEILPSIGKVSTLNRKCIPVGDSSIVSANNSTKRFVIVPYIFSGTSLNSAIGTNNLFFSMCALLGTCKQWNSKIYKQIKSEREPDTTKNYVKHVAIKVPYDDTSVSDDERDCLIEQMAIAIAAAWNAIFTEDKNKKGTFEGTLMLKSVMNDKIRPYYECPTQSCAQQNLYDNYEFENLFGRDYL
jgi:hypothetical protein